jgi:hypothetical protein
VQHISATTTPMAVLLRIEGIADRGHERTIYLLILLRGEAILADRFASLLNAVFGIAESASASRCPA